MPSAASVAYAREILVGAPDVWRRARELRRIAERSEDPEAVVEAAFSVPSVAASIRPVQLPGELIRLARLVRDQRPATVLEIGTSLGGTLYVLAWASADTARILSLDTNSYDIVRRSLYRRFARRGQHVVVWRADSRLDSTERAVRRFFGVDSVDVLFIDGDHSYDTVHGDFDRYAPLVRTGGLIAFHDIVDGPPERSGDVPRFWKEVRSSLEDAVELVDDTAQDGYGIGIGRWKGFA